VKRRIAGALLGVLAAAAAAQAQVPALVAARGSSPVILTGIDLPAFSTPSPIPFRPTQVDEEELVWITPPNASTLGANVATGSIAVFAYRDGAFDEIPSQVDEKFWRYLQNLGGENGTYSGYDLELTFVMDEEGIRRTAGVCYASFPEGEPVTTPDPIPGFDDDDELVFMARDAAAAAPALAQPIAGAPTYEVEIVDPLTGDTRYVYVVSSPGHVHDFGLGYVAYERDEFSDRYVSVRSGNGNPEGPRCSGPDNLAASYPPGEGPVVTSTGPRRPRDTGTFTSDRYQFHWGGRWIPDEIRIETQAESETGYGPDLIDQWKGRAFQLAKEQLISVGFIGDSAWEGTSADLGHRVGPVRVIRETWGAKSGTNVTRVYTLYDELFQDQFNLRVHPIPPDGIYSMYDHNAGSVNRYYSPVVGAGVPIDGVDDEVFGNVDVAPGTGLESHYDFADPTVQPLLAPETWEQVAGPHGSIVYYLNNDRPGGGVITMYYRDDLAFHDGSGSDPVGNEGSFGTHGVHFFATGDTDNLPFGFPITEVNVVQSQYMLPGDPGNVGEAYATAERIPLEVTTSLRP
jgi:hypothetical protein